MISKLVLLLLIAFAFEPKVYAQDSPDLLWNRLHESAGFLSICKTLSGNIFSTDVAGNWQFWRSNRGISQSGKTAPIRSTSPLTDERVLCGCDDGTVVIWNSLTEKISSSVFQANSSVDFIAASPDGRIAAVGADDGTCSIIELATGKILNRFTSIVPTPVAFSVDNSELFIGLLSSTSTPAEILIVDARSGSLIRKVATGNCSNARLQSLVASPINSKEFAFSSSCGVSVLNDAGKLLHRWQSNSSLVDYSPSGKMLASAEGQNIGVYELSTENTIIINAPALRLRFLSEDSIVSFVNYGLQVSSITQQKILDNLTGHLGVVRAISFSADGVSLLTAANDLHLYNASTGQIKKIIVPQPPIVIASACPTRDLSQVIIVGTAGSLSVCNTTTGTTQNLRGSIIGSSSMDTEASSVVAMSSDESMFAVAVNIPSDSRYHEDRRNLIELWSLKDRRLLRTLEMPPYPMLGLRFSLDGARIAATGIPGTYVWDTKTGIVVDSCDVQAINLSFDNEERELLLFQYSTLFRRNLIDHTISSVEIAGLQCEVNDQILHSHDYVSVSSSFDSPSIQITDVNVGKIIWERDSLQERLTSIAVNPVTGDFVTGSENGSIICWRRPPTTNQGVATSPPASPNHFARIHNHRILVDADLLSTNWSEFRVYNESGNLMSLQSLTGRLCESPVLAFGLYFAILVKPDGSIAVEKIFVN